MVCGGGGGVFCSDDDRRWPPGRRDAAAMAPLWRERDLSSPSGGSSPGPAGPSLHGNEPRTDSSGGSAPSHNVSTSSASATDLERSAARLHGARLSREPLRARHPRSPALPPQERVRARRRQSGTSATRRSPRAWLWSHRRTTSRSRASSSKVIVLRRPPFTQRARGGVRGRRRQRRLLRRRLSPLRGARRFYRRHLFLLSLRPRIRAGALGTAAKVLFPEACSIALIPAPARRDRDHHESHGGGAGCARSNCPTSGGRHRVECARGEQAWTMPPTCPERSLSPSRAVRNRISSRPWPSRRGPRSIRTPRGALPEPRERRSPDARPGHEVDGGTPAACASPTDERSVCREPRADVPSPPDGTGGPASSTITSGSLRATAPAAARGPRRGASRRSVDAPPAWHWETAPSAPFVSWDITRRLLAAHA